MIEESEGYRLICYLRSGLSVETLFGAELVEVLYLFVGVMEVIVG